MRTKTLLTAVAALAIGAATSMAQTYSQNVVGYVNVPLIAGFTMVANQLDLDGTGTNNTIFTVMGTNLPNNLIVEAWNGTGFSTTKWSAGAQKWSAANAYITNSMQPGSGFFVSSPLATNITLVGTVIQGTNNYPIVAGYQIVAPNYPSTGGIATTFGYHPTKNDVVEVWNGTGFSNHKWSGSAWSGGGEPVFPVGVSVFYVSVPNTNWTQIFTVPN